MSTPNDKIRVRKTLNCAHLYTATVKGKGAYGFGNTPQEARDSLARQTAQPSPAAVEQATQPQQGILADMRELLAYAKQLEQERDALQAQRNELVKRVNGLGGRLAIAEQSRSELLAALKGVDAAIARATEGEKANES